MITKTHTMALHYSIESIRWVGLEISQIQFETMMCLFSQHSTTLIDSGFKTQVKQYIDIIRIG